MRQFYFAFFVAIVSFCKSSEAAKIQWITPADKEDVIIFVHGFLGDPTRTFHHPSADKTWPQFFAEDVRANDPAPPLSQYSIGIVDYQFSIKSNMSAVQFAEQLKTDLLDWGLFAQHQKSVTFIAHSMGGLLIKRLLTDVEFMRRADGRITSVFLIAVPSGGSLMAEEASKILPIFAPRALFDLKPIELNGFLQSLNSDFRVFIRERDRNERLPRIYCAYETLPMSEAADFFLGQDYSIVVGQVYSEQQCDIEPRPVDADHLSIVKPHGRDSEIYVWVRGRIRESSAFLRDLCNSTNSIDKLMNTCPTKP